MNSTYDQVLHRGFLIAAETGERCRPVHLLAALAEGDGPISDALRPPDGGLLFPRPVDPSPAHGGGASYLAMQTDQAARRVSSQRSETTTPAHLLLAVLDQGDPEAVALLSHSGLVLSIIRTAALNILAAPPDLPQIVMPALCPAGTMDRPPLGVDELDPAAWAVLCWRQDHLPLRRLQRRSHYEALQHLESRASWRTASNLGLDDDQRYSLSRQHLERVEQLAAQAKPGLVELRSSRPRFATARMMPVRRSHRRRWRKWLRFTVGWGTWLSNRQVGLRDRWFRVLTIGDYKGAPQP